MQDLDIDPFLIENWEQYCTDCIKAGEIWRFRKALADFTWYQIRPEKEALNAYIMHRRGEIDREKLDEIIKRKKPRVTNVNRKLI